MKTFATGLLAIGLVLSGAWPAWPAGEPYEINVIMPMTGAAAFVGKEIADALHLVEQDVNASGGVRGRPIAFDILDDQTNPQVAVQLTNAVIAKKGQIFFGSVLAAMCNAEAAIVKDGPAMYCYSPSIHPTPGGYVFSAMYSTEDILAVSLHYFHERGLRRIAILDGTDATGVDADKTLDTLVHLPENAGMSFVAIEHYNLGDITVAAQLARIKAAGAQAIVSYVTGGAFATILHGMADAGMDLPIVSSPGNMSYAQLASYKAFVPKELLFAGAPIFVADQIADAGLRRSVSAVAAKFRAAGIRPDNLHAIGWDVAQLTVQALRKLGPDATAAQIRDELNGVRGYYGGLGRYDFRAVPQRGLSAGSLTVVRWDGETSSFVAVSKFGGRL